MTNPHLRMGLQIPSFTYPDVAPGELFERVSDIAVTAEDNGFDSVFVMDHFYQLPSIGRPEDNMFEGLDGIVCNMPDAYDLDAVALAGTLLQKAFK